MVAIFALPSTLKINHALFEHNNFVCKNNGELHVHEVEMECEFHKYNISHFIFHEDTGLDNYNWTIKTVKIFNFYRFLSKYQQLHFSKRGPPSLAWSRSTNKK